jgi:2-polyprenyl-3-methyl-5-hydroxy-6-metoxy-1,4-benzoquinol methylase
MACFYQKAYKQSGLTTDLPTDEELARMCQTLFRGTEKDFSFLIRVLEELGVRPGARILDFGANWGYTSYQLRQAGYDPFAYEISTPRAVFGKKLGISIATELTEQDRGFDAVFSSHVLEHVPNPLASLKDQLDRVKPGGYVIGLTPNGSRARRENDPQGFHTAWGRVHPVLLSDAFLDRSFDRYPAFISGRRPQPDELRTWAGQNRVHLAVDQPELFFVLRNT